MFAAAFSISFLAVGWLMLQVRRFATDLLVANTIALLTGFPATYDGVLRRLLVSLDLEESQLEAEEKHLTAKM